MIKSDAQVLCFWREDTIPLPLSAIERESGLMDLHN